MQNKLLLMDGNSILNRAFFGVRELTNAEGLHTNAIFGFLNMMTKMIDEEKATHLVVAFDLKAPTFRHERFAEYKGTRKGMPSELAEQVPVLKGLLQEMGIRYIEKAGYEADDLLGTIALKGSHEAYDVTVFSGDRDMLQIATEQIKISIPKTKSGNTITEHYYAKDVEALYGVTPKEFIDIKGLMGDTSDNIPGVQGIGEKTASKLIQDYHSIENLYLHLEELSPKIAEKLSVNQDLALLSKELATICTHCEIQLNLSDCLLENIYTEAAYQTIKKLEFRSFYDRFQFERSNPLPNEIGINRVVVKELAELNQLMEKTQVAYYFYEEGEKIYAGFAVDKNHVYYVDSELLPADTIKNKIKSLLTNPGQKKITLDVKEQLHVLDLDMDVEDLSVSDLSLMAYLLNPMKEFYHADDLANDYLNVQFTSMEEIQGKGKSKVTLHSLDKDKLESYFTSCAQILWQAGPIIEEQLSQAGLKDVYEKIELPLTFVLKDMESKGVLVDSVLLKEYGKKLEIQLLEIEQRIYTHAGEEFNINSPKQLGVILFEKLNLPTDKKTKTSYSTAADVLEKLKKKHPIIEEILNYRQLSKLKSTYADGLFQYIREDGRIHTSFNQKIAATGRISSTDPNLQNIPIRMEIGREIRKVFIPKPGYAFVDADYSQIELRLLAHLSQDETFIEAFNKNLDIHTMTASQVFHVPFDEVTSLQRRNAKAVNFGIVYGISAFGLSEDLSITRKEASDYIEGYFAKYPKVKEFLDRTVLDAKVDGQVKTMYGRIRKIPELSSGNFMQRSFGERIAMNTPIQGSAADIMKLAMIRVFKALKEQNLEAYMVLTVHDELVIETAKEAVESVQSLVVHEMEHAAKLLVPLTVDAHSGMNWYEAK